MVNKNSKSLDWKTIAIIVLAIAVVVLFYIVLKGGPSLSPGQTEEFKSVVVKSGDPTYITSDGVAGKIETQNNDLILGTKRTMNDGVIHPIIFQQNGKEVARFSSIFQSLQLTERFASGDGITSYNLNTFVTHLGIGTGYNNKYLGDDGHSYLGPKKLGLIRGDIKLGSQTEYSVIMDGKSSIEYLTLGTGSKGYQSASIPGAHAALNFWEGSDGVHYVKGVAISPRYIYFVDGTEDQYLNFVRCKPDLTTGSMKCVKSNEAEFNFDVGYDESLKSTTTQRANLFKFSSNTVDSVKSNLYTP